MTLRIMSPATRAYSPKNTPSPAVGFKGTDKAHVNATVDSFTQAYNYGVEDGERYRSNPDKGTRVPIMRYAKVLIQQGSKPCEELGQELKEYCLSQKNELGTDLADYYRSKLSIKRGEE